MFDAFCLKVKLIALQILWKSLFYNYNNSAILDN